jgi:hypothetical protein
VVGPGVVVVAGTHVPKPERMSTRHWSPSLQHALDPHSNRGGKHGGLVVVVVVGAAVVVVVGAAVVVVLVVVVVVVAHWWLSRIKPGGQHSSSARHCHVGGQHSLSQQSMGFTQHSGPQARADGQHPSLAVQT